MVVAHESILKATCSAAEPVLVQFVARAASQSSAEHDRNATQKASRNPTGLLQMSIATGSVVAPPFFITSFANQKDVMADGGISVKARIVFRMV